MSQGSNAPARTRALVIVESPTKQRQISGFLGDDYVVRSSMGHIRDLPQSASQVPAKEKDKAWARLGVDVDDGFEPLYVVSPEKKQLVRDLARQLKGVDALYLATDEDREGEAIAWHLLDLLKPTVPVRRMVFHEITPSAIAEAVANTRDLDTNLVDAQETRRILDRLYGYEVSPVLWKKVMPRLSAGRVQSVALRLVVDRERERIAFRSAGYADLIARVDAGENLDPRQFTVRLVTVGGKRVASGRDFDSLGQLKPTADVAVIDTARAESMAAGLTGGTMHVLAVDARPYRRSPYAPFRTTTMQQEAGRKLGFTAARAMQVAQRLYENGHITYMRTDSTTLSATAISAARAQVRELYGDEYLPASPRTYANKVKNAQEAHEAIRPAGDSFETPAQTGLRGDEFRLYELIWMRTIASQMNDARGQSVSIRVGSQVGSGPDTGTAVELTASGKVITFHGFLKAYVEGTDDPDAELDSAERRLPDVQVGSDLATLSVTSESHETRPPSRFTEQTLISELESREIGRPSTYASIIGTIQDRGYVYKKGSALVPAWLAFSVVRLLEEHFSRLVDYTFTARMEDVLDNIATGDAERVATLRDFYFGSADDASAAAGTANQGLKSLVTELGDIDARDLATFPLAEGINVRVGRYGPYLEDEAGNRANVPDDLPPDELTLEKAQELLSHPAGGEREVGRHPDTGFMIVAKDGRYGPYVTEQLPEDSKEKPRTASLFKSMNLDEIGLDDALLLLSLPRELGNDASGEPITALNGRYGPYVKRGSDSRSLESEEQLFAVTLEQALALLAEPKRGRGRTETPPLRTLGDDPASGEPIVVKEGRFGAYVTDGTTNATLRKDDDPASVTLERAAELLEARRLAGPPAKRTAKKAAAKKSTRKAPAKKTAAKKTAATAAKNAPAKKSAAKKAPAKKAVASAAAAGSSGD
ncbi:MAG TPA: type I DNA topoisomerase [Actinopolymorphaceae bacterium]